VDASPDYFALLLGELAVVFMHGPGEIMTGAKQLFERRSHILSFARRRDDDAPVA